MNLIEQLGGYEEAKMLRGTTSNALLDMKTWTVHVDDIDSALLEHRRANNIFEVGDFIVLLHTNYRSDVFALTKSFKEIYDEKGIVYRQATDAEIQAGVRV